MFLLFLLSFFSAFAQNPDGDDYKPKVDYIFKNLDKSPNRIKTGILYETSYNLTEENRLDGNAGVPITLQNWKIAYYSLLSGKVNNANPFPTFEETEVRIAEVPKTEVHLPIFRIDYNSIRRDAFQNKWLNLDNSTKRPQINDTKLGLQNNPYATNIGFAIAPTQEESKTGSATFNFNKDLYFTNTDLDIIKIVADFDDGSGAGGYGLGDIKDITWTTNGIKNLKFIIYFSDGSETKASTNFKVTIPEGSNARYTITQDFVQYITYSPILGAQSNGNLYIKYATNNTSSPRRIKKPLIVLGGYDPSNTYFYRNFIADIGGVFSQFNYNLSDIGNYDLVFVDYNHGGASILTNALLFRQVLVWVNSQKALAGSTEQNVVLGISMGGLVARYGLADMVKNTNIPTETRLLITHDSPHRGANIPAAMQYLGRKAINDNLLRQYVAPVQGLADFANSPAANEMLNYYTSSNVGTIFHSVNFVENTFIANVYQPMVNSVPNAPYKFIAKS